MISEHQCIMSEIRELEELLKIIPEKNLIDRMSLQNRLDSANELLSDLSKNHSPSSAVLTFRGKPVIGTHGIFAEFASKATMAFSDAFVAVVAGLGDVLSDNGPLPNKIKNQLVITGVAVGSFGFELELPYRDPELFPEMEELRRAMVKIESLLRLSADGSDDEVAELVEEVHPRAVRKVYEFLDCLVKDEAWCGFEFEHHHFMFSDYDQIQIACDRLKSDNIKETKESYRGEFQGVLPKSRTFEFKLLDEDEVIRGKLDASIEDPDMLNRKWLHRFATVCFYVVRVGQGRPRYRLMSLGDLK